MILKALINLTIISKKEIINEYITVNTINKKVINNNENENVENNSIDKDNELY